jgi:hypothetical protein
MAFELRYEFLALVNPRKPLLWLAADRVWSNQPLMKQLRADTRDRDDAVSCYEIPGFASDMVMTVRTGGR